MSILALARPNPEAHAAYSLLTEIASCWRSLMRDLFDAPPPASAPPTPLRSYRPERHYMRGPGPKWHAKHGAGTLKGAQ
jgi:hypothetical protein